MWLHLWMRAEEHEVHRLMLIFFTILKIIGIVFLIAACLIGIVLFVPVFYELDADIDEGKYTFRLSWLFSLIRFCFTYQEKMTAVLSVLFFRADFADPKWRAAREEKKKKRQEKKRKKAQKKKNRKRDRQREKYLKEREKNRSSIDLGESLNEAVQGKKDEAIPGEKAVHAAAAAEESAEKQGIPVPKNLAKIIHMIHALYDSGIFGAILPRLQLFLIRIRPRKLKGELHFGFRDPATTGQVLGMISMIPYLFQTELQICPDFEAEEAYIKGKIYVRGRIHMIFLVQFAVRVILDKKVRSFLKAMKKKK